MSFDSIENTVKRELNPVDFAEGFYDSALRQPVNAIKQLCGGHVSVNEHRNDSLATTAGNIAGFVADFMVVSKLTGLGMNRILGTAADTVGGSAAKMFVAGGAYGGFLTPSSDKKS